MVTLGKKNLQNKDQQLNHSSTPLDGNTNLFLTCGSVYMNYIVSYHVDYVVTLWSLVSQLQWSSAAALRSAPKNTC